ncbi:MAG TPA: hypothetical protein VN604_02935 [Nitrospirota bacterium]|nr:hypothetical protein [Nitrospirota bacterium]
MSPVPIERVKQLRAAIHDVLKEKSSDAFIGRIDAVIDDWAAGKLTAAQTCEKIQKLVGLFIGEDKAKEIGNRCAPIVMKEFIK